ncbi:hypothetical protein HDU98_003372 [Podochytrium sp. JEL0797]|nr:hypothetical protein HDU98_003372 [Podochytrium sp. JEL0797]
MNTTPREIKTLFLLRLDNAADISNASMASREFHRIVQDRAFWRILTQTRFGKASLPAPDSSLDEVQDNYLLLSSLTRFGPRLQGAWLENQNHFCLKHVSWQRRESERCLWLHSVWWFDVHASFLAVSPDYYRPFFRILLRHTPNRDHLNDLTLSLDVEETGHREFADLSAFAELYDSTYNAQDSSDHIPALPRNQWLTLFLPPIRLTTYSNVTMRMKDTSATHKSGLVVDCIGLKRVSEQQWREKGVVGADDKLILVEEEVNLEEPPTRYPFRGMQLIHGQLYTGTGPPPFLPE